MIKKIVIVGSGNVATHLAKQFFEKEICIKQVYSRTLEHAKTLATHVDAEAINQLTQINTEADLYLICLTDSAVNDVINKLTFEPKLIAHTAGSLALDTLNKFKNRGVFYPLQTFSKERVPNYQTIPFCIEANTTENEKQLIALAKEISLNVTTLDSTQRKQYHLAAVFANNFSNHMFAAANSILQKDNLNFDLLKPLILETALKVQDITPIEAQTGPAVRNNRAIIQDHIQQLSSLELEKLYSFVSNSIIALHNKQ